MEKMFKIEYAEKNKIYSGLRGSLFYFTRKGPPQYGNNRI